MKLLKDSDATLDPLKGKTVAVLGYGNFITVAINFIIIAFVLFLVIRGINMMAARNKKEEAAAPPPAPAADVVLLGEIRDQLVSLNKKG
jgi:large conductance mechanosensitive channel